MGAKFSKNEISEVIRRVLTYYLHKRENPTDRKKVLFFIPKFPVGLQETISEYELYGELDSIDFFVEDTDIEELKSFGCKIYYASDAKDVSNILNHLSTYEKLEIYDPSLDFLRDLKEGKERNIFIKIAIFFLMSEKPVIVRLPYDMDHISQGVFGRAAKDLKDDLCDMGIHFSGLKADFAELFRESAGQKLDFVSEEVINQCYERGEKLIYVSINAVVTPLAVERAKELSIGIIKS